MSTTINPDPNVRLFEWAEELLRYGPELGEGVSRDGSEILSSIRKMRAAQTHPANIQAVLGEALAYIPMEKVKLREQLQVLIAKIITGHATVTVDMQAWGRSVDVDTLATDKARFVVADFLAREACVVTTADAKEEGRPVKQVIAHLTLVKP